MAQRPSPVLLLTGGAVALALLSGCGSTTTSAEPAPKESSPASSSSTETVTAPSFEAPQPTDAGQTPAEESTSYMAEAETPAPEMPTPSPAKDTTGSGSQSSDEAASGTSGATAKGGVSQDSATRKASDYLAFMAFSRSGLIEQLEYEGFTIQEATAAVDSLATNYNEQAAKKAKEIGRAHV